MSYGPKGPSPKQRAAIRHNSFIGLSVAIQKNARTIADAQTSTDHAKFLACTILDYARYLERELRTERKDT